MIDQTIEDFIKSHISFVYGKTGSGWYRVYCAVCGDGSRTKGPRGGWIFENGITSYHCFNCGIHGSLDLGRPYPFSKEMRKILNSFGIGPEEYNKLIYFNKVDSKSNIKTFSKPEIKYIDKPDYFSELYTASPQFIKKVDDFLSTHYKLKVDCYPFLYSTGKTKSASPRDIALAKAFVNRLVIPYYKDNKLVYYEGRSLDNTANPKYLTADASKSLSIYGFDKLFTNIQNPLYVTEGFFDAFHLNGVAVFQNKMSHQQIEYLKSSPRQKIIIPDNKNDNNKLLEQAIEQKWEASFPDIGNCKDISEAIIKYGKIYVAMSIVKNIKNADEVTFLKSFKNVR